MFPGVMSFNSWSPRSITTSSQYGSYSRCVASVLVSAKPKT